MRKNRYGVCLDCIETPNKQTSESHPHDIICGACKKSGKATVVYTSIDWEFISGEAVSLPAGWFCMNNRDDSGPVNVCSVECVKKYFTEDEY